MQFITQQYCHYCKTAHIALCCPPKHKAHLCDCWEQCYRCGKTGSTDRYPEKYRTFEVPLCMGCARFRETKPLHIRALTLWVGSHDVELAILTDFRAAMLVEELTGKPMSLV